jgi:hypothetical protein
LFDSEEQRNSKKAALSLGTRRKRSAKVTADTTLQEFEVEADSEQPTKTKKISAAERQKRKSVAAAAKERRRTMK